MTLSLLLTAFAALAATSGAATLGAAHWPQRAPRLGIVAWQALTSSILVAAILAGLTTVVPHWTRGTDLGLIATSCVMLLQGFSESPGAAVVCAIGVLSAVVIVGRLLFCAARTSAEIRAARRRQRAMLGLVARHDPEINALVVDHAECAAYCLPGRKARIVVTSAAIQSLERDQLDAVLAHERAHLRGRHHLVVAMAGTLRRAFPFVPAFATAADAVPRLVEMAADDVAVRGRERRTLATALVRLAEGGAPVSALAAGGDTALARIRRLTSTPVGLGVVRGSMVLVAAVLLLVVPVTLVAGATVWFPFLQTCL
jgi:Zn-dependent protease with chaperone function